MKRRIPFIRKQTIGENVLYTLVFVVVYLIPIFNSFMMAEEHLDFYNKVFRAWSIITPYLGLFLFNNYILIRFLLNKGYVLWYVVSAFVSVTAVFVLIETLERFHIISDGYVDVGILPHQASLADLGWYWNIVLCVFMFAANIGIKKLYESMQKDEDNARLAREIVEAEMYYLKYQINPHFLMNTLNNIHALVDIDAEAAKQGIVGLSDMMRHVVYESTAEHIPFREDMKFLENYIALMRVRYSQQIDIQFNYPKTTPSTLTVPPLVFIVFIENAFKHGVSRKRSSYIHIDMSIEDDMLVARFENSVHPSTNSNKSSGGIGLENVSRRLEYLYGNNYSLDIVSSEDRYCVTLKLPKNYES